MTICLHTDLHRSRQVFTATEQSEAASAAPDVGDKSSRRSSTSAIGVRESDLAIEPRMRTPLRHALVAHFHARGFQPCFIDPSPRFVLTLVSEWQFAPFWPSYASLNPILTQALSHFTSTRLRAEALEERCLRPCRLVWPYHAACCLCPQPRECTK